MRGTWGSWENATRAGGNPAGRSIDIYPSSATRRPRRRLSPNRRGARGLRRCGIKYRSADRRRVLDAALVPQFVQTAVDFQRRVLPDIAFERLAVIADELDDADRPVLAQAQLLAVIAFGADETLDFRIGRFRHFIDIRLCDPQLFGVDHREQHPFDDVEPQIGRAARKGR